jgi:hypothetical protein
MLGFRPRTKSLQFVSARNIVTKNEIPISATKNAAARDGNRESSDAGHVDARG